MHEATAITHRMAMMRESKQTAVSSWISVAIEKTKVLRLD